MRPMTASRSRAISICRRAQGLFRRSSPCMAAAGSRARAAHSSIGALIWRRAATAFFRSAHRLAKKGQKTFPQAVHDVVAGVQFLRANAAEHRIDADRLGLFGASAGGHLAALAALGANAGAFIGGYPGDPQHKASAKVKVLVGVYGVYDLIEMWERYRADSPRDNNIENFLGCSPMEDRRIYFDATPINYATYANNQTAVLLSCGTEDDLVDRRRNTDAFLRALKQAGLFTRTCIVQGAGHYWASDPIDEPGSYSAVLAPRLIRFLAEKL